MTFTICYDLYCNEVDMKIKKRIKTLKKLKSASLALDFNLFDVLPEDVLQKLDPTFKRPTIGFKIVETKLEKEKI